MTHSPPAPGIFYPTAEVSPDVHIAAGTRIWRQAHVREHAYVGESCLKCIELKGAEDWEITPTLVKYGASIGAGSVIVCGITIGEFALIGAGSVVTRDVHPHALVFGNPARHHGYVCRCARRLSNVQEQDGKLVGWCETCGQECRIG